MNINFKNTIAVILATIWISISEFTRNEFFLKAIWQNHYQRLGLDFPTDPIHGFVWGLWSLLFAVTIFLIARRFTLIETAILSWLIGFVLMWIVIWNLLVLPMGILPWAIPLSLLESFVASWIIFKHRDNPA